MEAHELTPRRRRTPCACCETRELALFADLTDSDLARIRRPIDDVLLDAGDPLYGQGAPAEAIYTVRRGLLKLAADTADGRSRIVRLARPGDALGLEGLLDESYRHSAVALEGATLCRVPRDMLLELVESTPRLCRQIMMRVQRSLDEADHWLTALAATTTRARVAHLLAHLARRSPDGQFTLLARDDMGALLDISKESASRAVAELRRRGVLREVRRGCYEADVQALEASYLH
jgi:CRP-like cAMP-binding protein